jgi:hypothetical protein
MGRCVGAVHAPDRGDVDDLAGALLLHGRDDALAAEERAADMYVEHALEVGRRDLLDRPVLADAGIVDQNIDRAELGERA